MIVFKNYLKIAKSHKGLIILYTLIFLFFAVFTTTSSNTKANNFTEEKTNIALINRDKNSTLIKGFEAYLKEKAELKDIEDKDESLKDALFIREVDYIIIIPNNFTEEFMNGKKIKLEVMSTADSTSSYTKLFTNDYLNLATIYRDIDLSEEEIVKSVKKDFSKKAVVKTNTKVDTNEMSNVKIFYNFANYTFLALALMIIGLIMTTYNQTQIKKRNLISNKPYKKISTELFLANVSITFSIWLFYVLLSFILYEDIMMTKYGLLFIINSFIFGFTALSIGFLIGSLVKNKEVNGMITNVISLGSSFLCGAFVPQEWLGENVLSIARILPSYWYINSNELIGSLTEFTSKSINPIIGNMIITLLFGILFFLITIIFTKKKDLI